MITWILEGKQAENSYSILTSPAGSLLAVKLHSEVRVTLNGKYEILISLILQWQDNTRKTIRANFFRAPRYPIAISLMINPSSVFSILIFRLAILLMKKNIRAHRYLEDRVVKVSHSTQTPIL